MDQVLQAVGPGGWTVFLLVAVGFVIVLVVECVRLQRRFAVAAELKNIRSFVDTNDDFCASEMFIRLLGHATERIEVLDDGNRIDGSVYEDPEVVEALAQKLEQFSRFQAFFFFNADEELLLRDRLESHERVHVFVDSVGNERDPDEVHFKIIDRGRLAYLSNHLYGDDERSYEILDCRRVSKKRFAEATKAKFGDMLEKVHKRFPDYARAEAA